MAGPVQETSPQQQATKRSAEADLEPSPVTKRPAEDPDCKHQSEPMDASTNSEDAGTAAASKQQPSVGSLSSKAAQSVERNAAQATIVQSTENGEPAIEHQPEVGDTKVAKNTPASGHLEAENGEVEVAGHTPDPAAVASQLVTEAAAAQEEAQKVAKIAAQKQAEAVEALQAAAKEVPADQSTAQPVVKEASETVPAAPQESAKPVGAELSSEPHAKDTAPHAPVQPTEQKISEATPPPKEPEAATNNTSIEVPPKQPAPVIAPAPVPELPPTMATPTAADTVFPPPVEMLTPANPLPQTASTPLIGNVPPQAVENLKAASKQAASILPLQPTQEILEQQASIRTTPLTQPVDQGVAPMEE